MKYLSVYTLTQGEDGKSINSVTEYYAISNNKNVAPQDADFSTTMVVPTKQNPYLWNYERVLLTDGTPLNTSKRVIGMYGEDGKGVVSITNKYLVS